MLLELPPSTAAPAGEAQIVPDITDKSNHYHGKSVVPRGAALVSESISLFISVACFTLLRRPKQTPRLYNYHWGKWLDPVHSPLTSNKF